MRARFLLLVVPLSGCGFLSCNTPGPPPSDTCDEPSADAVSAVTLVERTADVEIADGDVVPIVWGPQGGTMIGLQLGLTSTTTLTCIPVAAELELERAGAVPHEWTGNLRVYAVAGDQYRTGDLWLIEDFGLEDEGQRIRLRAEAGGAAHEVHAWLERIGVSDASIGDGPPADGASTVDGG
jgi:hypothetical protein